MRNLENMKIRMLAPTCPETKRMNEWIEKDIHEALTAGYLHSLHFCVCKDREGTDLIEQYTYTFTYTTDGMPLNWPLNLGQDIGLIGLRCSHHRFETSLESHYCGRSCCVAMRMELENMALPAPEIQRQT